MNNSLNDKRNIVKKVNIYYLIILILALIIMIVGITMAYFSIVASQKENGTQITTGTLEISFTDGIEIKNPKLIPRNTPINVNDDEYAYSNTFTIASLGTLDQSVDVYVDISQNEFIEGNLKYKLYNEKKEQIKEGIVNKSGKLELLDNTYLDSKQSATYTLLIWLVEDGTLQNEEQDKSFIGTMRAEAVQIRR